MASPLFFRVFEHLLPRAYAWLMKEDGSDEVFTGTGPIPFALGQGVPLGGVDIQLGGQVDLGVSETTRLSASGTRRLMMGMVESQNDQRVFVDGVWGDAFPASTRDLPSWESQFGLPSVGLTEAERRLRVAAEWRALGGQDPTYLQGVMQDSGFNVFIHEWWEPGGGEPGGPFVARIPSVHISADGAAAFLVACDEPLSQCGEPAAQAGETSLPRGRLLVNPGIGVVYAVPTDPAEIPYVLYWGAETFPEHAQVPASRKEEFERLLLSICPAQQWLALLVDYP